MNIRVLLIEPDTVDASFVQDVFVEMSAGNFWHGWVTFETIHAATWDEAVAVLANDAIDIVFLAPGTSDTRLLVRFRLLEELAPGIPIVVLAALDDRELAVGLLREGAQDILLKSDLDCKPLARAMRHALERQRFVAAIRAASLLDALTGLVNREAFFMLAGRDRSLAARLEHRLLFIAAEPEALARGSPGERNDLVMMEASEFLRTSIGPADLLGRISATRFGLAIFDSGAETVERAWMRLYSCGREHGIRIGGSIFDVQLHPADIERLLEQAELDLAGRRSGVSTAESSWAHGATGS